MSAACAEAALGEVVQAVNFNSPGQVVIAGHAAAVKRACDAAKAKGAKRALPLPVSAPFHSALMQPAAERLRQYLQNIVFNAPRIPVIICVPFATRSNNSPNRVFASNAVTLAIPGISKLTSR